ncbi:MAG: hypothetical protein INQ03_01325 [Candidatus Heimdallarchaeota archaeon]|nr:hypothetical protein [Candidatus Heimdallarchaeota archaeon]
MIFLILIGKLIHQYYTLRYPSILYLIFAVSFLFLVGLQHLILFNVNPAIAGISIFFLMQGMIFSLILLLMFFDSFKMDTVLSPRNVILLIISFSSVSVIFILLIIVASRIHESQGLLDDFTNTDFLELFILSIFILFSFFYTIYLIIQVLKSINRHRKLAVSSYQRKIIKKFQIGTYLIIFGRLLAGPISFVELGAGLSPGDILSNISTIVGLILIMKSLHFGLFAFQGENVRRLLIITKTGIPLYAYTFSHFNIAEDERSNLQESDGEVLFSGALKSISMLIGEFTGVKEVEGISLEGLELLISNQDEYSVVLFADRSTRFHRHALHRFAKVVEPLVLSLKRGLVFNNDQTKEANSLLEQSFGSNLDWDL